MAGESSKQAWIEIGIRLIGVYLAATHALGVFGGLYTAIFGGVPFFSVFFHSVIVEGVAVLLGGFLAFSGGKLAELLCGSPPAA